MGRYSLAIFDMDGTILDTLEDLKISLNQALSACGLPERGTGEVRRFVGNGIQRMVERAVPEGAPAELVGRVFSLFDRHYAEHCFDNTKPYPGITGAIRFLIEDGVKTAVVSNKADYAVQALCARYFDGLFEIAVGEKAGIRKKPHPDMAAAVLKALCVEKEAAVYIGDSEVDIQTARNAGLGCISVDWGFRTRSELESAGAGRIVSDPAELRDIISGGEPKVRGSAAR